MSGISILTSVFWGTMLIIAIVGIVTFFVTRKASKHEPTGMVFLGRLANTDSSIEQAMDYLKLTNSVTNEMNGSV